VSDPLLRWRPEFPILERTTYLISNSLGAMPRSARCAAGVRTDLGIERREPARTPGAERSRPSLAGAN